MISIRIENVKWESLKMKIQNSSAYLFNSVYILFKSLCLALLSDNMAAEDKKVLLSLFARHWDSRAASVLRSNLRDYNLLSVSAITSLLLPLKPDLDPLLKQKNEKIFIQRIFLLKLFSYTLCSKPFIFRTFCNYGKDNLMCTNLLKISEILVGW